MNDIQNHPVAKYLEEHHRLPYWSQAMGVIGVLEEMGMITEDPYGPPPKDKIVTVKVDVLKLFRLLRKWIKRKDKRCGKLTTMN